MLMRLHELGIQLSMEILVLVTLRFLSAQFPIDVLKIDRSLSPPTRETPKNQIVNTIITLAGIWA